jgi:hypothetical protein
MNLESRIKRIEQKFRLNEESKNEGITLKVTGNTTEETIQNALSAIREAKEKNQRWHWVSIDCPKEVDISAVVRAIVEMLARERWGVSD